MSSAWPVRIHQRVCFIPSRVKDKTVPMQVVVNMLKLTKNEQCSVF